MEYGNPVMRQVYDQLATRITLVQYDGRGTGHSQRDVVDLSLEAMLADLEAVVDQAGFDQFSLLGQYSSCAHALAYTARHPERVRRLVLFGGSARTWDVMSANQTQALLSLIEKDWNLFADTAAPYWMGWAAGEAGRATAEAFRQAVTPQVARATVQAASATDVTAELARVQALTLVLHRRDAPQVAIEVSRSLATCGASRRCSTSVGACTRANSAVTSVALAACKVARATCGVTACRNASAVALPASPAAHPIQ